MCCHAASQQSADCCVSGHKPCARCGEPLPLMPAGGDEHVACPPRRNSQMLADYDAGRLTPAVKEALMRGERIPPPEAYGTPVESLYGADDEIVFWRGTQVGEEWRDVTEIRLPIAKVEQLLATMKQATGSFAKGGN